MRTRNRALLPGVSHATCVTDEVQQAYGYGAGPVKSERLHGPLARINDHVGVGHLGDRGVELLIRGAVVAKGCRESGVLMFASKEQLRQEPLAGHCLLQGSDLFERLAGPPAK